MTACGWWGLWELGRGAVMGLKVLPESEETGWTKQVGPLARASATTAGEAWPFQGFSHPRRPRCV